LWYFLKNFLFCTDIISHLGEKACMSSSARIFCKFKGICLMQVSLNDGHCGL
jgi:hypothetical protein